MEFVRGSYEESKEFKEKWAEEFKLFKYEMSSIFNGQCLTIQIRL